MEAEDPFSLSAEQLISRLEGFGIENVDEMDVNDRMILYLQLTEDAPPVQQQQPVAEAASRSSSSSAQLSAQVRSPLSELDSASAASVAQSDSRHIDEASNGAEDVVGSSDAAQYEEAITSLCSITGTDGESARHLLEALGWDLDAAVSMYMEQETNETGANRPGANAGGQMAPDADPAIHPMAALLSQVSSTSLLLSPHPEPLLNCHVSLTTDHLSPTTCLSPSIPINFILFSHSPPPLRWRPGLRADSTRCLMMR